MSGTIIPFDQAKLPASVAGLFNVERLGSAPTSSFPVISIKGKVFHKVQGDRKELITKPNEDEPAGSIEVVIVGRNPNRSKVFYATGYTEGSDAKPTCYSNNGISPELDAEQPQAKKCATCQNNQWGSRVTENGAKGKACSDSQRLAVAPIGLINDPMLIRVPAASLKALDQFGESLVKRNVPYQLVAVKIGFDYSVAHPALTFKPIGMVDEPTAHQIAQISQADVIQQIIGLSAVPHEDIAPPPPQLQADPVVAAPKPAPAPAVEPTPIPVVEPVAQPTPAPVAPQPTPAPVVSGGLEAEIANVMAGLDFDDE
jgi:hypothetical protein